MVDATENHRFWHSFCVNPQTRYETQRDNEKVILTLRAHPITQIHWIINSFFLLILLIVGDFFLTQFVTPHQVVYINAVILSLIIAYFWSNFVHWFFNVGIITDQRIIDIDFHNVLYKEITEARLDKVEDMTSKGGGFFSSIANYGNVYIATAAEIPNVEFLDVPDPSGAIEIINRLLPNNEH